MRILIADDEFLARATIKSMLEDFGFGANEIAEATNGEDLINQTNQRRPDVVFVDIRMPKLDGLQAIYTAQQFSPETHWIILTGFPEFEYAQEAIRLGVSSYLLKPVNPDDLYKALAKARESGIERKAMLNKQFERALMAFYYELGSADLEELDGQFDGSGYICAALYLDSSHSEKNKAKNQTKLRGSIRKIIEDAAEVSNRLALFVMPTGELVTVAAWENCADAKHSVRQYIEALQALVEEFSQDDLAVTMLISERCSTFEILQTQLGELQALSPLRVVAGIGAALGAIDLKLWAQSSEWLTLSDVVLEMNAAYAGQNYLCYRKEVEAFQKVINIIKGDLPMAALCAYLRRALGINLPIHPDLKILIDLLNNHGNSLLTDRRGEDTSLDLVAQVKAFVDENYSMNIGIGQIADQLKVTPNYLSTLFHRKTGTTFMNYLKGIRMLKAQELLMNPNLQIQQVAEQVGYFSARHFARLFTEQFGCLPSDYRDTLRQKAQASQPIILEDQL